METIHPAMIYDPGPLDNNDNLSKNFYNNHHHHHQQQQQQHHPELEHLAKTMPKPTIINNNNNNDESNSTKSPSNNSTNIRSQSRMSISHDKGLLNMPGQNNCFLNSAVQVILNNH